MNSRLRLRKEKDDDDYNSISLNQMCSHQHCKKQITLQLAFYFNVIFYTLPNMVFSSVQSLSCVRLFVTP